MNEYLIVLPRDVFEGNRAGLEEIGISFDYLDAITTAALSWGYDARDPFQGDFIYSAIESIMGDELSDRDIDLWGVHEHVIKVIAQLSPYIPDKVDEDGYMILEQIDCEDASGNIYFKLIEEF